MEAVRPRHLSFGQIELNRSAVSISDTEATSERYDTSAVPTDCGLASPRCLESRLRAHLKVHGEGTGLVDRDVHVPSDASAHEHRRGDQGSHQRGQQSPRSATDESSAFVCRGNFCQWDDADKAIASTTAVGVEGGTTSIARVGGEGSSWSADRRGSADSRSSAGFGRSVPS